MKFSLLVVLVSAVALEASVVKVPLVESDEVVEVTTTGFVVPSSDEAVEDVKKVVCTAEEKQFASFGCPREATPAEDSDVKEPVAEEPSKEPDFNIPENIHLRPATELPEVSAIVTKFKKNCLCGVPAHNSANNLRYHEDPNPSRIVGGTPAKIKEYPWTVGIIRMGFFGFGGSGKPFCGGSLINDRYIVTASHCVDGQIAQNLQVILNEEDLKTNKEANTTKYSVERIIMHPQYDRSKIDNDIALIKLATPVKFENEEIIRPVCLPANNNNDFTGLNATAAGWGTTSQGGSQSSTLLKVDVPVISNQVCNGPETNYKGKITANMLCAGSVEEGGKDACQGDSGGPLIIENGGRRTLVGVVSWGYGCAKPKSPGVYTRVARFPEWILTNTQDATWCA